MSEVWDISIFTSTCLKYDTPHTDPCLEHGQVGVDLEKASDQLMNMDNGDYGAGYKIDTNWKI